VKILCGHPADVRCKYDVVELEQSARFRRRISMFPSVERISSTTLAVSPEVLSI